MWRFIFIAACLVAALSGCQTMPQAYDSYGPGAVIHFVAIWLKNPEDAAAKEKIAAQTRTWLDYPGVVAVACGESVAPQRPIEQEFDFGVLMVFENEAALRKYLADPEHQQAVREVLAPAAAKVQVYDFTDTKTEVSGVSRAELRDRQQRHYAIFAN